MRGNTIPERRTVCRDHGPERDRICEKPSLFRVVEVITTAGLSLCKMADSDSSYAVLSCLESAQGEGWLEGSLQFALRLPATALLRDTISGQPSKHVKVVMKGSTETHLATNLQCVFLRCSVICRHLGHDESRRSETASRDHCPRMCWLHCSIDTCMKANNAIESQPTDEYKYGHGTWSPRRLLLGQGMVGWSWSYMETSQSLKFSPC